MYTASCYVSDGFILKLFLVNFHFVAWLRPCWHV